MAGMGFKQGPWVNPPKLNLHSSPSLQTRSPGESSSCAGGSRCLAQEANWQPSLLTTAAAPAFGSLLLPGPLFGGGTVEKQSLTNREYFYFRSPQDNLSRHWTPPHWAKLSAAQRGADALQGALICLSLSWEKSHLSPLLPALSR